MDEMELPWRCVTCNQENMIDLEKLAERPLDRLVSVREFRCEKCGMWQAVCFRTVSLMEQIRKLMRYPPQHPKFGFLFARVLRKAGGVNQRGELIYGEIRRKDMAPA
jgi:hypothetical protein